MRSENRRLRLVKEQEASSIRLYAGGVDLSDLTTRLARILARATERARGRSGASDDRPTPRTAIPGRRTSVGTGVKAPRPPVTTGSRPGQARGATSDPSARSGQGYLGDWSEALPDEITWQPQRNGRPDPGEVVWAWVPFEEDHAQGKDRPVLVVAVSPRSADAVLALPLTSKDHDRDAAQEARAGRHWMDVGVGAWDRSERPSEVRLDRVLQLRADDVRREGAALEEKLFREVYAAARAMTGR